MNIDTEVWAALFAARVRATKMTEAEIQAEALTERQRAIDWIKSNDKAEGSFLWLCVEFDIEPTAVRRNLK